jgi:hypothetical protein
MAKRKIIDGPKLIKMIESGAHVSKIIETFGFANTTQATLAYAKAQIEAGKLKPIMGGRGPGKAEAVDKIRIGKSGKISLSKDMVTEFGFKVGDEFTVKKRGEFFISLKKVIAEAEAPKTKKTKE